MVAKLCTPNGPSVYHLSKETGISPKTLYNWIEVFGGTNRVTKDRRPDDWSQEERLQAVLEAQALSEEDLGDFLRKNGLHSHDIEAWKKDIFDLVSTPTKGRGRPKKDPELAAAQEELKKVKRDLRRKEKALAEQTAIVILQKKAQELWGTDEDEE